MKKADHAEGAAARRERGRFDEALRRSVGGAATETKAAKKSGKKPRKASSGQKEMLMPIAGKKQAMETAAQKPAAKPQRKSA